MIANAGLDEVFVRARGQRRAALIAYIVAGDPDRDTTLAVIDALTAAGVDLISIGWLTHSVSILDIGLDFKD